jgi:hypothetical protein
VFREVNERIREINASLGPDHLNYVSLLCECGRPGCTERLEVPSELYDVVRDDHHLFLVAPGHEVGGEYVVAQAPTYLVVASYPEPA